MSYVLGGSASDCTEQLLQNFKSIRDLTLDLSPLTVLEGECGAGMSTVLEAMDFLLCGLFDEYWEWVRQHAETNGDLWPRGTGEYRMSFSCEIELPAPKKRYRKKKSAGDEPLQTWQWEVTLRAPQGRKWIRLEEERVLLNGEVILWVVENRQGQKHEVPEGYTDVAAGIGERWFLCPKEPLNRSALGMIPRGWALRERLEPLLEFLSDCWSVGALHPDRMRMFTCEEDLERAREIRERNSELHKWFHEIGPLGMGLPTFLAHMTMRASTREDYHRRLQTLLAGSGMQVVGVRTFRNKAKQRFEMELTERFGEQEQKIPATGIGEGLLRLMGVLALCTEVRESSCLMMDDVGEGIDHRSMEALADLLKETAQRGGQLLLTTKSTNLLDDLPAESIVVLYRGEDGSTCARPLCGTAAMRDLLTVMYPGEVLINLSRQELVERLTAPEETAPEETTPEETTLEETEPKETERRRG